MPEKLDIVVNPDKTYLYVIEGANVIRTLAVNDRDMLMNTDGMDECLLEAILRKSKLTYDEVKKWNIEKIRLVEVSKSNEKVLGEYNPERLLDLLQV